MSVTVGGALDQGVVDVFAPDDAEHPQPASSVTGTDSTSDSSRQASTVAKLALTLTAVGRFISV